MTSELVGKFRSKADFIKYFRENLQLYVPPEVYINKDFLKQVLQGLKKLLELSEVRYVNVPLYDELSVKKFYPMFLHDEEVMSYLPDARQDGRKPDRTYFFNLLNTLKPEYMRNII